MRAHVLRCADAGKAARLRAQLGRVEQLPEARRILEATKMAIRERLMASRST